MKTISLFLFLATVALADPPRIFLYRPLTESQVEIFVLGDGRCARFTRRVERRTNPSQGITAYIDSRERLMGDPPRLDHEGNILYGRSLGVTLIEGKYYYPSGDCVWGTLHAFEVSADTVTFSCGKTAALETELIRGKVGLHEYSAVLQPLHKGKLREGESWRVAYAAGVGEQWLRNFYTIQVQGSDSRLLPENARFRLFLSMATGRLWGGDRRKMRTNRRLVRTLRDSIVAWSVANNLSSYVMVSEALWELDALGELMVYLPNWLLADFRSRFAPQILSLQVERGWGDHLMVAKPVWRAAGGHRLSLSCALALVNSLQDARSVREMRDIFRWE